MATTARPAKTLYANMNKRENRYSSCVNLSPRGQSRDSRNLAFILSLTSWLAYKMFVPHAHSDMIREKEGSCNSYGSGSR